MNTSALIIGVLIAVMLGGIIGIAWAIRDVRKKLRETGREQ